MHSHCFSHVHTQAYTHCLSPMHTHMCTLTQSLSQTHSCTCKLSHSHVHTHSSPSPHPLSRKDQKLTHMLLVSPWHVILCSCPPGTANTGRGQPWKTPQENSSVPRMRTHHVRASPLALTSRGSRDPQQGSQQSRNSGLCRGGQAVLTGFVSCRLSFRGKPSLLRGFTASAFPRASVT